MLTRFNNADRYEIILAVNNFKAGNKIAKTDEIKGCGIVSDAITRLQVRIDVSEQAAIEIVKFCLLEDYNDTEIFAGKKLTKDN